MYHWIKRFQKQSRSKTLVSQSNMTEAKLLVLFLLLTNLLAQKNFADSLDQCSATPGVKLQHAYACKKTRVN